MISKKEELFEQLQTIKEFFGKFCVPITAAVLLLAIIGTAYAAFGVNKVYYSTAKIYVRPYTGEQNYLSESVLVSQDLTEDGVEITQSIPVLENAIFNCGFQDWYTAEALQKQMYAYAETQSRIITVTVMDSDPSRVQLLSNAVCDAAVEQINSAMNGEWSVVAERANLPDEPEYPVLWEIAVQSVILGLGAVFLLAVLYSMRDYQIRSAKDVEKYLGLTLLGTIPEEIKAKQR